MEVLTIEDVAQHLHVSVHTVRWLRQQRRFVPAIRIGRRLMWTKDDIDQWLIRNRESYGEEDFAA